MSYDFLSTTKLKMTAQNQARATVAIQIHRIVEKGKMFTKVSALADIHAPFFGPVFS